MLQIKKYFLFATLFFLYFSFEKVWAKVSYNFNSTQSQYSKNGKNTYSTLAVLKTRADGDLCVLLPKNSPKTLPDFAHSSDKKNLTLSNFSMPTCNDQEKKQIELSAKHAYLKDGRPKLHKAAFPLAGVALGGCVIGTVVELIEELLNQYDEKNQSVKKTQTTEAKSFCLECIEKLDKKQIGVLDGEVDDISDVSYMSYVLGGAVGSAHGIPMGVSSALREKLKTAYIKHEKDKFLKDTRTKTINAFEQEIKKSTSRANRLLNQYKASMHTKVGKKKFKMYQKEHQRLSKLMNAQSKYIRRIKVPLPTNVKTIVEEQIKKKVASPSTQSMKLVDYIKKLPRSTVTSIFSKIAVRGVFNLWTAAFAVGSTTGIICANGTSYLIDSHKPTKNKTVQNKDNQKI